MQRHSTQEQHDSSAGPHLSSSRRRLPAFGRSRSSAGSKSPRPSSQGQPSINSAEPASPRAKSKSRVRLGNLFGGKTGRGAEAPPPTPVRNHFFLTPHSSPLRPARDAIDPASFPHLDEALPSPDRRHYAAPFSLHPNRSPDQLLHILDNRGQPASASPTQTTFSDVAATRVPAHALLAPPLLPFWRGGSESSEVSRLTLPSVGSEDECGEIELVRTTESPSRSTCHRPPLKSAFSSATMTVTSRAFSHLSQWTPPQSLYEQETGATQCSSLSTVSGAVAPPTSPPATIRKLKRDETARPVVAPDEQPDVATSFCIASPGTLLFPDSFWNRLQELYDVQAMNSLENGALEQYETGGEFPWHGSMAGDSLTAECGGEDEEHEAIADWRAIEALVGSSLRSSESRRDALYVAASSSSSGSPQQLQPVSFTRNKAGSSGTESSTSYAPKSISSLSSDGARSDAGLVGIGSRSAKAAAAAEQSSSSSSGSTRSRHHAHSPRSPGIQPLHLVRRARASSAFTSFSLEATPSTEEFDDEPQAQADVEERGRSLPRPGHIKRAGSSEKTCLPNRTSDPGPSSQPWDGECDSQSPTQGSKKPESPLTHSSEPSNLIRRMQLADDATFTRSTDQNRRDDVQNQTEQPLAHTPSPDPSRPQLKDGDLEMQKLRKRNALLEEQVHLLSRALAALAEARR